MTENIKNLLDFLQSKEYRKNRNEKEIDATDLVQSNTGIRADALLLQSMLEHEKPLIFENDIIGFNRTQKHTPFYKDSAGNIRRGSNTGNICPNYARAMLLGLDDILAGAQQKLNEQDSEKIEFYQSVILSLEAVLRFADRCREYAKRKGLSVLYDILCQVPHKPAITFHQACVFLKCILFTLRCNQNNHITLGRFDQYMLPYYLNDKSKGKKDEELFEILEALFISINFDTDLYFGVQQGDNGQSMVLGGYDLHGTDMFNPLSEMCMKASLELKLIDPKINLRVAKNTTLERYAEGTRLTMQGLGFPQYSNDDIVVPGLIKLGYSAEDSRNYAVAACWEFIIPHCGMDIPNSLAMNFPRVINDTLHAELLNCSSFTKLLRKCTERIKTECDKMIADAYWHCHMPSPYLSVYVDGCLESGRDISQNCAKYNNSGCHGVGIASAADALAAVKKLVYDEKSLNKRTLLNALDNNFKNAHETQTELLNCPKMGNNDAYVDDIASRLMEAFTAAMNGKKNSRGGIYRAGTGSAQGYYDCSKDVPATADGRKAGQAYGCSFSPSLTAVLNGPLSVIQSFTKFNLTKIINGGPLTLEIHDSTFRNEEGITKTAQLVEAFIDLGGHQLQLNAINRERLLDAQKHPEKYPHLVVRVWGWSGYFCELDTPFQKHIIDRTVFTV